MVRRSLVEAEQRRTRRAKIPVANNAQTTRVDSVVGLSSALPKGKPFDEAVVAVVDVQVQVDRSSIT